MHSLKTKIGMLSVWITVIAVVVATLMSMLFVRNAEQNNSDQILLLLCETGKRNLDYYLSSVEKSVRRVASYTEKDLEGLEEEQLRDHTERVRAYFGEAAEKTNGVLTYYYRIDPDVSAAVRGFWYTDLTGEGFTEHEVTDITRYDTGDTSSLVWFTVPKKTGSPVWLSPYITENLDVRVISYNIPVFWHSTFVGVIGIEVDYSTMAEQIESIRLYSNGYAFLTDGDGSPVFHPRMDLTRLSEDEKPAVPDGVISNSTFISYTFEGVRKSAAWLSLSNGMRLYVSVPEAETEGDWRRLIYPILIGSLIVLVLSNILTYIVTCRIIRPLKQLTEAARQADEGNYDFILDYRGKDEIGTLTSAFSRMAAHMKEHITDLNKRVYVDALTSVRNKGAYTAFIGELQASLDENPDTPEFAVGIFDCDDLKSVNDLYGHEKGDLYLKNVSRLICRIFQHSPVFRIGGDEFSVILRNEDYKNRAALTEAFEKASAESCASAENRWEKISVAMGIAVYDPKQDQSVIDTVHRADKMMYANKRRRKGAGE